MDSGLQGYQRPLLQPGLITMKRQAGDVEFKESLDRMRETVLARLELKRPLVQEKAEDTQYEGFTIRRLWDRFFSSVD